MLTGSLTRLIVSRSANKTSAELVNQNVLLESQRVWDLLGAQYTHSRWTNSIPTASILGTFYKSGSGTYRWVISGSNSRTGSVATRSIEITTMSNGDVFFITASNLFIWTFSASSSPPPDDTTNRIFYFSASLGTLNDSVASMSKEIISSSCSWVRSSVSSSTLILSSSLLGTTDNQIGFQSGSSQFLLGGGYGILPTSSLYSGSFSNRVASMVSRSLNPSASMPWYTTAKYNYDFTPGVTGSFVTNSILITGNLTTSLDSNQVEGISGISKFDDELDVSSSITIYSGSYKSLQFYVTNIKNSYSMSIDTEWPFSSSNDSVGYKYVEEWSSSPIYEKVYQSGSYPITTSNFTFTNNPGPSKFAKQISWFFNPHTTGSFRLPKPIRIPEDMSGSFVFSQDITGSLTGSITASLMASAALWLTGSNAGIKYFTTSSEPAGYSGKTKFNLVAGGELTWSTFGAESGTPHTLKFNSSNYQVSKSSFIALYNLARTEEFIEHTYESSSNIKTQTFFKNLVSSSSITNYETKLINDFPPIE